MGGRWRYLETFIEFFGIPVQNSTSDEGATGSTAGPSTVMAPSTQTATTYTVSPLSGSHPVSAPSSNFCIEDSINDSRVFKDFAARFDQLSAVVESAFQQSMPPKQQSRSHSWGCRRSREFRNPSLSPVRRRSRRDHFESRSPRASCSGSSAVVSEFYPTLFKFCYLVPHVVTSGHVFFRYHGNMLHEDGKGYKVMTDNAFCFNNTPATKSFVISAYNAADAFKASKSRVLVPDLMLGSSSKTFAAPTEPGLRPIVRLLHDKN